MINELEKALFHLEAEEFDKAEKIFSDLFDANNDSSEVILGLVICKIAQSDFNNNYLKAANIYFDKLESLGLNDNEKNKFIDTIFVQIEKYFLRINKKFRDEANELAKRPALEGQLYSIKKLKDTADYMGFINENVERYNEAIKFSSKIYNFATRKEDTAFKIVSLLDKIFNSIKDTPQMTGKSLLDAKDLVFLKDERNKWANLSGKNKSRLSVDPSDTSGCLVLIAALSGLSGSLLSIFLFI